MNKYQSFFIKNKVYFSAFKESTVSFMKGDAVSINYELLSKFVKDEIIENRSKSWEDLSQYLQNNDVLKKAHNDNVGYFDSIKKSKQWYVLDTKHFDSEENFKKDFFDEVAIVSFGSKKIEIPLDFLISKEISFDSQISTKMYQSVFEDVYSSILKKLEQRGYKQKTSPNINIGSGEFLISFQFIKQSSDVYVYEVRIQYSSEREISELSITKFFNKMSNKHSYRNDNFKLLPYYKNKQEVFNLIIDMIDEGMKECDSIFVEG